MTNNDGSKINSLIAMLDSPKRKEILPIDKTIAELDINSGSAVIDVGCGIGYFSLPFSDRVKKVYALDMSEDLLLELKKRAEDKDKSNIEYIKTDGSLNDVKSLNADYAFISTVLHEVENKDDFINQVKRLIKEDGEICVLEFNKERRQIGPPACERIGTEELKELFKKQGLKVFKHFNISEEIYVIIFIRE